MSINKKKIFLHETAIYAGKVWFQVGVKPMTLTFQASTLTARPLIYLCTYIYTCLPTYIHICIIHTHMHTHTLYVCLPIHIAKYIHSCIHVCNVYLCTCTHITY